MPDITTKNDIPMRVNSRPIPVTVLFDPSQLEALRKKAGPRGVSRFVRDATMNAVKSNGKDEESFLLNDLIDRLKKHRQKMKENEGKQ